MSGMIIMAKKSSLRASAPEFIMASSLSSSSQSSLPSLVHSTNHNSNGMNELPDAISSYMYTYLSLVAQIRLSTINRLWQRLSQLSSSHSSLSRTFRLAHLYCAKTISIWIKRLSSYGISSLTLPYNYTVSMNDNDSTYMSMVSSLRSLSVGTIDPLILVQLTNLTSLTIGSWSKMDDMEALLSLPLLTHYRYDHYHSLFDHQVLSMDWLPLSLTSLEFQCYYLPRQLRQLLIRLSLLRHLQISIEPYREEFPHVTDPLSYDDIAPLLHSSTITSLALSTFSALPSEWFTMAGVSMPLLQRVDTSYSPLLLRALSIAAPNITDLGPVGWCRSDDEMSHDLSNALPLFKHLQKKSLELSIDYANLCPISPPISTDTNTRTIPRTISSHWLQLVNWLTDLSVVVNQHDSYSLTLHKFSPLIHLTKLLLLHPSHDSFSLRSIWYGSFVTYGLPHLRTITIVQRLEDRDYRRYYDYEPFDGSYRGDTDRWQPFIASCMRPRTPMKSPSTLSSTALLVTDGLTHVSVDSLNMVDEWLGIPSLHNPSLLLVKPSQIVLELKDDLESAMGSYHNYYHRMSDYTSRGIHVCPPKPTHPPYPYGMGMMTDSHGDDPPKSPFYRTAMIMAQRAGEVDTHDEQCTLRVITKPVEVKEEFPSLATSLALAHNRDRPILPPSQWITAEESNRRLARSPPPPTLPSSSTSTLPAPSQLQPITCIGVPSNSSWQRPLRVID
jgi:hypothetical protein